MFYIVFREKRETLCGTIFTIVIEIMNKILENQKPTNFEIFKDFFNIIHALRKFLK